MTSEEILSKLNLYRSTLSVEQVDAAFKKILSGEIDEAAQAAANSARSAANAATAAADDANSAASYAANLSAAAATAQEAADSAKSNASSALTSKNSAGVSATKAANSEAEAKKAKEEARAYAASAKAIDVVAEPGQLIVVKEVNPSGKPSKWFSMDRTHYEDVFGGGTVFSQADVSFSLGLGALSGVNVDLIEAGRTYEVVYGSSTYTCTAFLLQDIEGSPLYGIALGNPYLLGVGEDTRHPFCFSDFSDSSCSATIAPTAPTTVKIGIEAVPEVTLKRLPSKFLPDDATGFTLVSPNGTKFRLAVSDSGTLSVSAI